MRQQIVTKKIKDFIITAEAWMFSNVNTQWIEDSIEVFRERKLTPNHMFLYDVLDCDDATSAICIADKDHQLILSVSEQKEWIS